jgi:anti-anti-sigma factor
MKPHLTTPAVDREKRRNGAAGGAVSHVGHPPQATKRTRPGSGEPRLVLAKKHVWTHTLVLSGELDHRSAHALEAEIERLCGEGVTGITLDLRQLSYIDPIGVAVIAFRCGHCHRHGFDVGLIPGSSAVQEAFDQAGVSDALPFRRGDEHTGVPTGPATVVAEVMAAQNGHAT